MPATINIEPEIIDLTDFSGGWMPDLQEAAVPRHGLIDVNNLLPDRETGTLETRKGFARFSNLLVADYEVRALHPYNIGHGETNELGTQYLMAVIRKRPKPNPREIDDVQVWKIDVQAQTAVRIDDAGVRQWRHYAAAHWGLTIDNVYYGGSELDPIYSYRPIFANGAVNPDPYDPDASMGQWAANNWADATAYAVGARVVDQATYINELGKEKTQKHVFVCTTAHTSSPNTRPKDGKNSEKHWENLGKFIPEWASGATYSVGDEVSYLVTGNTKYPRGLPAVSGSRNRRSTFVCVRAHTAGTGEQAPPPGLAWEARRGPKSNVASYHGSRLWMRDSDAGSSRVRYTGRVTASGFFDITNWASDDTTGAGFMDIRSGDGDDVRAMQTLGQNHIILKRRTCHAVSGLNPATWTIREIGAQGALYKNAVVEHDGLVYFFGDQGFFMTDGAIVQEVPNGNLIREWIRKNIDLEGGQIYRLSMTVFNGFIWISFPAGESVMRPNITLVYDPVTGSFWKLDLAANQFAIQRKDRVDEMFFAKVGAPALVMQYEPTANPDQDDTGVAVQAFQDISWFARTFWTTFGPSKEQRRIRRLWVLLRAQAKQITVKLFRNYKNVTPAWTVTETTDNDPVNYVEGRVVRDFDPHAISVEVSGTSAPTSLMSISTQTQFRRKRYHREGINA